jgi:hypothetical protein
MSHTSSECYKLYSIADVYYYTFLEYSAIYLETINKIFQLCAAYNLATLTFLFLSDETHVNPQFTHPKQQAGKLSKSFALLQQSGVGLL